VRPPLPKETWTVPIETPFTVTFGSEMLEIGGDSEPFAPKVKLVPTLTHAV
jgi:hypothetical protein